MMRKTFALLVFLLVLAASAAGGIRGPGKYSGVVIFDQWGTCYLHSGVYLMYVSEKVKENLRRYEGQSVVIDAKKVFQHINPGDGLITEFEMVSSGGLSTVAGGGGLVITVRPEFGGDGKLQFSIELRNAGGRRIEVLTSAVGPTLFGEKSVAGSSLPSDGKSAALLTRCSLTTEGGCGAGFNRHGTEWREYLLTVEAEGRGPLPDTFTLGAGEARKFHVTLSAPAGNYDFMCGYSPGVHESRGVASNIISFAVDERGRAAELANMRSGGTR